MFTLPVHSSPLPAFSIIREITHFPSNLTPQNLRKCVCARSLAKLHSRDTRRNTRFNTQCTAFDSERTTRRIAYETIVFFSCLYFLFTRSDYLFRKGRKIFRCANSSRARHLHFFAKSGERYFPEWRNRNFRQWYRSEELFILWQRETVCNCDASERNETANLD